MLIFCLIFVFFVLKKPPEAQESLFEASLERASESALCWAVQGAKNAALRYNGPLPDLPAEGEEGSDDRP